MDVLLVLRMGEEDVVFGAPPHTARDNNGKLTFIVYFQGEA
jgi:hypothetical protein